MLLLLLPHAQAIVPALLLSAMPYLQVVALANLLPEVQETDDIDSYMYQTVRRGHACCAALQDRACWFPNQHAALFRRACEAQLYYGTASWPDPLDTPCPGCRWATKSLQPMPSAWACRCTAAASPDAQQTRCAVR